MGRLMQIKVKNLVDGLKPVDQAHPGELLDLRAAEDVELEAGQYYKIRLGIAMELPEGYEFHIYPRSSTFEKWGIIMANSVGIIDNSYRKEISFAAVALRKTHIHMNDKICQGRLIYQQPDADIIYVKHIDDTGRGGFGSTGSN